MDFYLLSKSKKKVKLDDNDFKRFKTYSEE